MRAQVAESGCGTVWAERCSVWHAYSSTSLVGHHLALLLTSLRLGMPRPGGAAPSHWAPSGALSRTWGWNLRSCEEVRVG